MSPAGRSISGKCYGRVVQNGKKKKATKVPMSDLYVIRGYRINYAMKNRKLEVYPLIT